MAGAVPITAHDEEEAEIAVYDTTDKTPTELWKKILKGQMIKHKVCPLSPLTPITPDKLRCVCLSDTHGFTGNLKKKVPLGDILIHAGDFTMMSDPREVEEFNTFLGSLAHRRKLVIAGNHEITFDKDFYRPEKACSMEAFGIPKRFLQEYLTDRNLNCVHDLFTSPNIIYLQDSGTEICGIRFYGSPWQPTYFGWGFNIERGRAILDKWNLIPSSTDILITHGPPLGYGDKTDMKTRGGVQMRAGCAELLSTVTHRVKPLYHVFGHIHEGHGVSRNGFTTFINAAICTKNYNPCQRPIVFDITIPSGFSKEQLYNEDIIPSFEGNLWGLPPVTETGFTEDHIELKMSGRLSLYPPTL